MPFIRLNKAERRRVVVFFTCLSIAVVAWLFFALSNQYNYYVYSELNYKNTPINKAFHPLQGDTVSLEVRGTGWDMLFSKLRLTAQSIDVDVSGLNQRNYIIFENQLDQLNQQFASDQRVVSVQPDTLYFDFSSRIIKKVPVNLVYSIDFDPQYRINDTIQINPPYVTVSGPADELKDIHKWDTDSVKAADVRESLATKVSLIANRKTNISVYPKIINIKIPVAEFTEKTVEVPVQILNGDRYKNIQLYPHKVKITVLTGLPNYPGINEESFEAVVDLDDWKKKRFKQLPVTLIKSPPFSQIVKIEPRVIDFIIDK